MWDNKKTIEDSIFFNKRMFSEELTEKQIRVISLDMAFRAANFEAVHSLERILYLASKIEAYIKHEN